MTFYEAAIRVLEAEGRPLHFQEITERSIQQNLLSHVGKTPELTMLSRLLAMARRKTERKVVVTARDMFALADWALPEEPDALALTAQSEIREEELLPPLRPAERHPEPRQENVRVAGRGAERKRWREEEDGKRKKKRFPPAAEVVFEILSDEGSALNPSALLERARERELVPEEANEQALLMALLEDNQRRIDAGRRPQFIYDPGSTEVSLERAGATELAPIELQAAFAAALGIPLEGGRPVLPKAAVAAEAQQDLATAQAALKTAAKEARRAAAKVLRRRLSELDSGTLEKAVVKVLHAEGFRELKVGKRSKDGPLLTARKREGNLELRYAIRLLKGNAGADRRAVQELRRDLGHYSAHVALLVSAGDARGDAKTEATAGGALVFLWCGDALAEKFLDAHAGVTVTTIESFELDERFFDVVKVEAEESQRRREERKEERKEKKGERPSKREREREEVAAAEEAPEPVAAEVTEAAPAVERPAPAAEAAEGGEEGDEDELEEGQGEEGVEGQAGPGERRRRRRRRRGRRGRGQKGTEGAVAGAEGAPEGAEEGAAAAEAVPAEGEPVTGAPEGAAEAAAVAAVPEEAAETAAVAAAPEGAAEATAVAAAPEEASEAAVEEAPAVPTEAPPAPAPVSSEVPPPLPPREGSAE